MFLCTTKGVLEEKVNIFAAIFIKNIGKISTGFLCGEIAKKNNSLSNNKKFTPLFYRIQQRIHEKKNLKRSFGLRSWLSQSLRGGVGVWVIIKSNSCNSEWNSALTILMVHVDNDLNEREQIDLRLVCFFNELLLLFCFLKLVLTM